MLEPLVFFYRWLIILNYGDENKSKNKGRGKEEKPHKGW